MNQSYSGISSQDKLIIIIACSIIGAVILGFIIWWVVKKNQNVYIKAKLFSSSTLKTQDFDSFSKVSNNMNISDVKKYPKSHSKDEAEQQSPQVNMISYDIDVSRHNSNKLDTNSNKKQYILDSLSIREPDKSYSSLFLSAAKQSKDFDLDNSKNISQLSDLNGNSPQLNPKTMKSLTKMKQEYSNDQTTLGFLPSFVNQNQISNQSTMNLSTKDQKVRQNLEQQKPFNALKIVDVYDDFQDYKQDEQAFHESANKQLPLFRRKQLAEKKESSSIYLKELYNSKQQNSLNGTQRQRILPPLQINPIGNNYQKDNKNDYTNLQRRQYTQW
ncbi:UNKNOWN [Stylonychia lemnae]|uniref:Transmembrane protein n=1 Tax=Stylonychia lemnae TaxID=5949 RepID=A0A078A0S7_STYLE|nr:UNKNOWN [Stylonychia lemnae]|eukprot:CDW75462.1 UNKNOWN [Stylonychia lemnae]